MRGRGATEHRRIGLHKPISLGITCVPEVRGHPPAHVHVHCGDGSVSVYLDRDDVLLEKAKRGMKNPEVRRAGQLVLERLGACWELWRKYHGEVDRV